MFFFSFLCLNAFRRFLASAVLAQVKSAAGASCDQACAARDGCNDEAWPTSEEEFYDAAKLAGEI